MATLVLRPGTMSDSQAMSTLLLRPCNISIIFGGEIGYRLRWRALLVRCRAPSTGALATTL